MTPGARYLTLRKAIPGHVTIVLAAKTRNLDEIREVLAAGASDIGYNYVQEALLMRMALGEDADLMTWHMIGHIQTNKINRALNIFNCFQTIDSLKKAAELNSRTLSAGKKNIPILLEINIAAEAAKKGFLPDPGPIIEAVRGITSMPGIHLKGLMTMGPADTDGPSLRPWFKKTKMIFDEINSLGIKGVQLTTLSMGMSDSYIEAIEEGSNMIRLGSIVFGER